MNTDKKGIMAGVDELVNAALKLGKGKGGTTLRYEHKEACRSLEKPIQNFDSRAFVSQIYEKLKTNALQWVESGKLGSKKNWRWVPRPDFSPKHTGLEVPLERLIAAIGTLPATPEFNLRNWTNQMPVAAGFKGKRCIDLVHRCGDGAFDFIELKTSGPDDSDNPLHASIEILLYGLIYVFSRIHREKLGYDQGRSESGYNTSTPDVQRSFTRAGMGNALESDVHVAVRQGLRQGHKCPPAMAGRYRSIGAR